mgnify:CR=1 FL=1
MAKKIQLLRGKEVKLKSATNPSGYALSDAEFFVDTTQHKVIVGDANATPDGRFALANESEVKAVQTEVEGIAQDVADIQLDYAQTASGNTITANSVAVGNADGKLTGVTGTAGQFIGFDANGVPIAQSVNTSSALNKSATVTLPVVSGTTATVAVSGMVANADPFFVIPQWGANMTDEKSAWNKIISVESQAGSLKFTTSGSTATAVTFNVFWTA